MPEIHIPAAFPAIFKSSLDWDLLGEQEPGLGGRRLYLPRGRMIGGSQLDQRDDLPPRQPARLRRLGRGRLRRLVATTRCSRTSSAPRTTSAARTPTTASAARSLSPTAARCSPLVDTMLEAAVQAGYEREPRPERRAARTGSAASSSRSADGRRCSTADAFLHPAAGRPNLEVTSCAFVAAHRLRGRRAPWASRSSATARCETVRAEREVILSAGTYQSPVLLMLSGIGPAEELAPFGIPVRENLPVGPQPAGPLHGEPQLPDRRADALRRLHARELRAAASRRAAARSARTSRRRAASSGPGPTCPRPTSSSTSRRRSSSTRA